MSKRNINLAVIFSLPLSLSLGVALGLAPGCNANKIGSDDGGVVDMYVPPSKIPGCTGSCLVKADCPVAMGPTTIKGVVNIPAGNLPIYNAKVYIPIGDALPSAPTSGASCDRCDIQDTIFATNTNEKGEFTLENVPSGSNIPLIVSVGKWRRTLTLPAINDCTTTTLLAEQTRLPKKQSEGNIPKIALSTGGYDALECLFRSTKLGLDDSEFTNPEGTGRVNLYSGGFAGDVNLPGDSRGAIMYNAASGGATFPTSNPWWNDATNLAKYDIVLLSCEGREDVAQKSTAAHQALHSYLNKGGRVFASHWANTWISNGVQLSDQPNEPPLSVVANFERDSNLMTYNNKDGNTTIATTIDRSFAKGQALANWLQANGATTTLGTMPVNFTNVTLDKLNPTPAMYPTMLPQSWVTVVPPTGSPPLANPASQYFSVDMPLAKPPAEKCGQMVFTDLHVSGARICKQNCPTNFDQSLPTLAFPDGCKAGALSPQEKALIFMLFDLTNCLQPVIG
jgi:hypothetical protein